MCAIRLASGTVTSLVVFCCSIMTKSAPRLPRVGVCVPGIRNYCCDSGWVRLVPVVPCFPTLSGSTKPAPGSNRTVALLFRFSVHSSDYWNGEEQRAAHHNSGERNELLE
jgi:hypothetical protein